MEIEQVERRALTDGTEQAWITCWYGSRRGTCCIQRNPEGEFKVGIGAFCGTVHQKRINGAIMRRMERALKKCLTAYGLCP